MFVLSNGNGGGVYDIAVTNEIGKSISIEEQDNYELVPDKFDISTLEPFESRVLGRDFNAQIWKPAIWSCYDNTVTHHPYVTVGGCSFNYLIPYKGNEHLLGTTKDCNNYYKTWEL